MNIPITSITGMSGMGTLSHQGTLGQNISFQYSWVPKILTMTKVNIASVKVMAILPVMLAPPGNKIGRAHV